MPDFGCSGFSFVHIRLATDAARLSRPCRCRLVYGPAHTRRIVSMTFRCPLSACGPVYIALTAVHVCRLLLCAHYANLNGLCHVIAGMSPLNMACNRKNSEVAKLFIQSGSNVNLADDKGNLPLHYVARNGDADVALTLLDAGQCQCCRCYIPRQLGIFQPLI